MQTLQRPTSLMLAMLFLLGLLLIAFHIKTLHDTISSMACSMAYTDELILLVKNNQHDTVLDKLQTISRNSEMYKYCKEE